MLIRRLTAVIASLVLAFSAGLVFSQGYPNRPIRIVAAEPGGTGDLMARLVAQGISSGLGQNVIVENRPSSITGEIVSKASPDGYTLLVAGGTFAIGPLLQKTSYDPVRDFSPISMLVRSPNVLVVHPSVAANSVKELIALAKAKPGELDYSSAGTGGSLHLAAELFKSMAGVNIVRVNYKSSTQALNDLLGGQVQLSFVSASGVAPHVKSGRLRALAVTSAEPSALAPGVPTIAATGVPGYESSSRQGAFAPANTPAAIVNRLNQEIVRVLNRTEVKASLLNTGAEAFSSSPEQFAAWMKSETTKWSKVIKDAGIKVE